LIGDGTGLGRVEQVVNKDTHWRQGGIAYLIAMFQALRGGTVPSALPPGGCVSEPSVFAALQKAGEAASLLSPETTRLRHYLWQEALGILREEREFPLYIMILYWYLNDTTQHTLPQTTGIYRQLLKLTCDRWES
ncbi:MAG TPA: hypothetical protein VK905_01535, partial [Bacillota bacterium]|nr:hypothetical protein [Bacillota bacterium]